MNKIAEIIPDALALPSDEFTLADREFCTRNAAEFLAAHLQESARFWAELAAKIERVLVGEYAEFTRDDAHLVQALHLVILKEPLKDGTKWRSRALSRLGVLVVSAERGRLAQLRGRRQ